MKLPAKLTVCFPFEVYEISWMTAVMYQTQRVSRLYTRHVCVFVCVWHEYHICIKHYLCSKCKNTTWQVKIDLCLCFSRACANTHTHTHNIRNKNTRKLAHAQNMATSLLLVWLLPQAWVLCWRTSPSWRPSMTTSGHILLCRATSLTPKDISCQSTTSWHTSQASKDAHGDFAWSRPIFS